MGGSLLPLINCQRPTQGGRPNTHTHTHTQRERERKGENGPVGWMDGWGSSTTHSISLIYSINIEH